MKSRHASAACGSTRALAAASFASCAASPGRSRVLDGMQAQYEHSPPTSSRSTRAIRSPLSTSSPTQCSPGEPPPMTITSKSLAIAARFHLRRASNKGLLRILSEPVVARSHTREVDTMRSDIVAGGTFPDYRLPDQTGTPRSLSELQGADPMVLILSRGHYCPKEHQQHLELAAFQSKVAVAYTQMVTIATDDRHTLQEFRSSVGASWTFLADPGRVVQRDLDIQEYTDPANDPMIPHTLVLKPDLVIHSIYNGYWFWGRPSVDDLWRDLRAAYQEVRRDWDLSAPGLREAWESGDYSAFHGWDKRTPETIAAQLRRQPSSASDPAATDHRPSSHGSAASS